MVAKKDFNAPGHIDLHKIPNLQVIKACQSLTSRGYVKTLFSWQYYYYTLTNEGIGMYPDLLYGLLLPDSSLVVDLNSLASIPLHQCTCWGSDFSACFLAATNFQSISVNTCTFQLNWSP